MGLLDKLKMGKTKKEVKKKRAKFVLCRACGGKGSFDGGEVECVDCKGKGKVKK